MLRKRKNEELTGPIYPTVIVAIPAKIPDLIRFTGTVIKIAKRAAVPLSKRDSIVKELLRCNSYETLVVVIEKWFTVRKTK